MATQMLQKRGTAAEWASVNPRLADGEIGFEEDTHVVKIGDGSRSWTQLPVSYISKTIVQNKGDLITTAAFPPNPERLMASQGGVGYKLTAMPYDEYNEDDEVFHDVSVGWSSNISPVSEIDAKGDLLVGSADNTVVKLGRGAPNQRLTVQADGSLAWVDMPDLSLYETTIHAANTYQPLSSIGAYISFDQMTPYASQAYAANYKLQTIKQVKATDTARASVIVPAIDPELGLNLAANKTYRFDIMMLVLGTAGNLWYNITGPSGSIITAGVSHLYPGGTASVTGQVQKTGRANFLETLTNFTVGTNSLSLL